MEKSPYIKCTPESKEYIESYLKQWGYHASKIAGHFSVDRCPFLVLGQGEEKFQYAFGWEFLLSSLGVEIFNVEEFIELAANLVGKTYKRKDMKKEFTKEDLKSGMVVKTRNNQMYLVVDNMIISDWGYIILNSYTENLQFPNHEYDIMAIYDKIACWEDGFSDGLSSAPYNGELIWKRKEPKEVILTMDEIAKKFGCSVEQLRIKK